MATENLGDFRRSGVLLVNPVDPDTWDEGPEIDPVDFLMRPSKGSSYDAAKQEGVAPPDLLTRFNTALVSMKARELAILVHSSHLESCGDECFIPFDRRPQGAAGNGIQQSASLLSILLRPSGRAGRCDNTRCPDRTLPAWGT